MKLPTSFDWPAVKAEIEREDRQSQKKNEQYVPPRLLMTDTANGKQYVVTLTSGALVFTQV